MKIKDLKKGDFFRMGLQVKYRLFMTSILLEGEGIPIHHQGKLLVYFDNCKQLVCDPETEVEVTAHEPVYGYGNSYTTGIKRIPVKINGFQTYISHFLKDGNRLIYVYTIKNKKGNYVAFDLREIKNFGEVSTDVLMDAGINLLHAHIANNPNDYLHLI